MVCWREDVLEDTWGGGLSLEEEVLNILRNRNPHLTLRLLLINTAQE